MDKSAATRNFRTGSSVWAAIIAHPAGCELSKLIGEHGLARTTALEWVKRFAESGDVIAENVKRGRVIVLVVRPVKAVPFAQTNKGAPICEALKIHKDDRQLQAEAEEWERNLDKSGIPSDIKYMARTWA